MADLLELLSANCIALDVAAETWQESIVAAGELLERAGIADAPYTQSMIDNVESNGPYIVVAPGFAFAHARPSPAVHHTGMSWVRLAHPVSFGHKTNDPVSLVVALAATDSGAHNTAMAELAKLLGDTDRLGLDAIYPVFFLSLLIAELRDRASRLVALTGALVALALVPLAPPGIPILAASAVALVGVVRRAG